MKNVQTSTLTLWLIFLAFVVIVMLAFNGAAGKATPSPQDSGTNCIHENYKIQHCSN